MQDLAPSPLLLSPWAALDPGAPFSRQHRDDVGKVPGALSPSLLDPDKAHALGKT